MRTIRDPEMPHGTTDRSRDFLAKKLKGREKDVISTECIHTPDAETWYTTSVTMKSGTVYVTDGFAIGYGGEGPRGLRDLILFNISKETVDGKALTDAIREAGRLFRVWRDSGYWFCEVDGELTDIRIHAPTVG